MGIHLGNTEYFSWKKSEDSFLLFYVCALAPVSPFLFCRTQSRTLICPVQAQVLLNAKRRFHFGSSSCPSGLQPKHVLKWSLRQLFTTFHPVTCYSEPLHLILLSHCRRQPLAQKLGLNTCGMQAGGRMFQSRSNSNVGLCSICYLRLLLPIPSTSRKPRVIVVWLTKGDCVKPRFPEGKTSLLSPVRSEHLVAFSFALISGLMFRTVKTQSS